MSVGNVQRIIKKYAALVSEKGVSLPDSVHCHMFRRTRATNLYQDGIAIELVSTVLGHARTDTTKSYYAKPSVEQLRDAMESVPTPVSDEAPMWEGNEDEMCIRDSSRRFTDTRYRSRSRSWHLGRYQPLGGLRK